MRAAPHSAAIVAAARAEAIAAASALDSEIAGARAREVEARQAERDAGRRAWCTTCARRGATDVLPRFPRP
jgi:hypothetical protein